MVGRKVVVPSGSPPPLAPYSPGIRAGEFLYVSGMLALASDGMVVGRGDVGAQTDCVLKLIVSVVEASGGTIEDIVFNQIFLRDLADYDAMNVVYRSYFPKDPPARYCIRADLVKPEFLVEIASTAYMPIPKEGLA